MTGTDMNASEKVERALAELAQQVRASYPGAAFVVAEWPEDEGSREHLEAVLDGSGARLDGLGPCEDEYALYDLVDPVSTQLSLLMHVGSDAPANPEFPGMMTFRLPELAGAQPADDPRALMVRAASAELLVNQATALLRTSWPQARSFRMDLPVDDATFPLHLLVLNAAGEEIAEARQISRLLDHLDPFADAESVTEALGLLMKAHAALSGLQLKALVRQHWNYQCQDAPAEEHYDRPTYRVAISLPPYPFHVRPAAGR